MAYRKNFELDDAERERRLSVEQTKKFQSSRFKKRMAASNYWKKVALVQINEKLDVYEEIVNRTEKIEDTGDQLLPTLDWLGDHRTQFTGGQHNRFMMLSDQFKEKLKNMSR